MGIGMEVECFDVGHVVSAVRWLDQGLVAAPMRSGASLMCATSSRCGGRPANGGCPASSSYARQPKA